MKPQIEKPSDKAMRFFTPELYVRFNSSNDEEADRADEAWETAIQQYHRHLNDIWDRLPSPVRKLTELCLHDSELLVCGLEMEPFPPSPAEPFFAVPRWSAVAVLSLQHDERITTLFYNLWDRVREFPPSKDWEFSKERKYWMYDEVDMVGNQRGLFVHRVLFSNGSVMEIPFVTVIAHGFVLGLEKTQPSEN